MFDAFDKVQVVNQTKPPRRSDTNFELDPMWLISAKAREKDNKVNDNCIIASAAGRLGLNVSIMNAWSLHSILLPVKA
jgi:hypothetical protein